MKKKSSPSQLRSIIRILKAKEYKVLHYRETCIGCNACVLAAPHTWRMNEEEARSELINGVQKGEATIAVITEVEIEDNEKAAEACPMRIIKVNKA